MVDDRFNVLLSGLFLKSLYKNEGRELQTGVREAERGHGAHLELDLQVNFGTDLSGAACEQAQPAEMQRLAPLGLEKSTLLLFQVRFHKEMPKKEEKMRG